MIVDKSAVCSPEAMSDQTEGQLETFLGQMVRADVEVERKKNVIRYGRMLGEW
jgi:hypothetical protein